MVVVDSFQSSKVSISFLFVHPVLWMGEKNISGIWKISFTVLLHSHAVRQILEISSFTQSHSLFIDLSPRRSKTYWGFSYFIRFICHKYTGNRWVCMQLTRVMQLCVMWLYIWLSSMIWEWYEKYDLNSRMAWLLELLMFSCFYETKPSEEREGKQGRY